MCFPLTEAVARSRSLKSSKLKKPVLNYFLKIDFGAGVFLQVLLNC